MSTKAEVLARLCMLCTEVNHYIHHYDVPSDCFCEERDPENTAPFAFSEQVLEFIETAVRSKIVVDQITK